MFRNHPDTEPAPVEVALDELIPLSVLALDFGVPPEGWPIFLGRRAIAFRPDSIGRDAISAGDAQRLLFERREAELKRQARLKAIEAEAVERDRLRRAQIWTGIPAIDLPVGVSASTAMLAAAKDAQPKRTTPLQEALSGESLTYHSYQTSPEDAA